MRILSLLLAPALAAGAAAPAVDPVKLADAALGAPSSAPEAAFVKDVSEGRRTVEEACEAMRPAGEKGARACAALKVKHSTWNVPAAEPRAAAEPHRIQGLDALAQASWDEAGGRENFDGGEYRDSVAAPVYAAPRALSQAPLPAPTAPTAVAQSSAPKKGLRVVAVSVDKLKELASKELYKERKTGLDSAYGVSEGAHLSGAGYFTAKILNKNEVEADPVKKRVREEATARGEKVTFLRTNTKAQLFGDRNIPIGDGGGVPVGFGLRLGGVVEIVETRAIPRELGGAWDHAKERVFLWPLSAKSLRETMRVGEDLTITGRVERGAGLGVSAGQRLGDFAFGSIGAGATLSGGHAADEWISLRVSKIDEDHVRLLLQKGDGQTLAANLSIKAGLDLYDDSYVPGVEPAKLDDGLVGKAVLSGQKSLLKKVEELASVELSAGWSVSKHEVESEGWGAVSLSEPGSAKALDEFFKFKPAALRSLPPDSTLSAALAAGRVTSEVRDVTHDSRLQARLSLLKITKTAGTTFYEVHWRVDDGPLRKYLVGVARSSWRGDVTKTKRDEESVMWYDLDTGSASVNVRLGPQDRLMTTTRERINDVIAAQKALGLTVPGKIDHPSPYLQFFGLGNYGRSEELGQFSLPPEGVAAVAKAKRPELLTAYLRADWLFEKESYPPGYIWASASKAPPWAETSDPAALAPVLAFLHDNAAEVERLEFQKGQERELDWLERDYEKVAPGRSLRADADRYLSAAAYANRVQDMQRSGKPEALIEMFLALKKDGDIDLKRAVGATAYLAEGNFKAYIEMTGKRVDLRPTTRPESLPQHPISELGGLIGSWR